MPNSSDASSSPPDLPPFEDWTADALFYEYSQAADPIRSGSISPIPPRQFEAELYADGPSRIVPLDLSAELRTDFPATSPALLASFVRITEGDCVATEVNASSQLFYCLRGRGWSEFGANGGSARIRWGAGDFVTLPAGCRARWHAENEAAFYWVHDEPLLTYLGATADKPRFRPTVFPKVQAVEELRRVAADPEASSRSRVSVLLANKEEDQTLTITHVLWAMFGILPQGQTQPPHRHQSVALDLILDCEPGCYTLLGESLDEAGQLVNPTRVDWKSGCAFVTPPGQWHSHHNESGADAHLIPIQDAGLQTYLRALDIQFTFNPEQAQQAQETAADISPKNLASP
jgi:gentisate 1,2-dioxygenase